MTRTEKLLRALKDPFDAGDEGLKAETSFIE